MAMTFLDGFYFGLGFFAAGVPIMVVVAFVISVIDTW